MKLGKLPFVPDRRDLLLENYIDLSKFPKVPDQFGEDTLISNWPMYGNDRYGCCVWSAFGHLLELWTSMGGTPASFTDQSILQGYSDTTGFNTNVPSSDRGTNMRDGMKYMANTGLIDASGMVHKLGAYVMLQPGNLTHLFIAMYLFGAVSIGIQFPKSAMVQFNTGKPWTVPLFGSPIEGGHCVPLVAKRRDLVCVTWAKEQLLTTSFYLRYCDEAWAMLSPDMLKNGVSLQGFNLDQLKADLQTLAA